MSVLVLRPSSFPEKVGVNQNDAIIKWFPTGSGGLVEQNATSQKDVKAKRLKGNDVKQWLGVCEWWEIWKWADTWCCGVHKLPVFMKILRFVQVLLVEIATWTCPAWQQKLGCPFEKCSDIMIHALTFVSRAQNWIPPTFLAYCLYISQATELISCIFSPVWQMARCIHVESIFFFSPPNVYWFWWHVTQQCVCNSLEKQLNFSLSIHVW